MRPNGSYLRAGGAIALMAITLSLCSAQEPIPDEYQVRAAIIVNLVRFVTFKPGGDDVHGPIRLCLLGYDQQSALLESYLSAHPIDGRPFQVRRLLNSERPEGCRVLYASPAERRRFDEISEALVGAGVLTISDDRTFAAGGGIVGLPVVGDRVEIQINLVRAEQSGIAISSRLLGLARVIRKAANR